MRAIALDLHAPETGTSGAEPGRRHRHAPSAAAERREPFGTKHRSLTGALWAPLGRSNVGGIRAVLRHDLDMGKATTPVLSLATAPVLALGLFIAAADPLVSQETPINVVPRSAPITRHNRLAPER
jgi:hypothetical protein